MHLNILIAFSAFCELVLAVEGVLPLRVERVPMHHPDKKHKRASDSTGKTIKDVANNQKYFYTTEVQIGTPPQKVTLLLDTGSSDTWVFAPNTAVKGKPALGHSVFDSSRSKTFKSNGSNWEIQYGIGSASGSWGHDAFKIGGAKLKSFSIGLASSADGIQQGIIGLGRKEAEATTRNGYTYDNLPWRLKAEGAIGTAAYSLFMDDVNSRSGTVLFGGVDHSRYTGSLVNLPVSHPKHLGVQLQGLYSDGRSKGNMMSKPQTAVLDSGTSLTYVPHDTLIGVQTALNANPSFAIGQRYYCDCNITNNLILDFGATKVPVPAYNFLWPIDQFVSGFLGALDFPSNSCYLGIEQAEQDFILVGDNVLRGMYLVYNLETNHIAVAPSKSTNAQSQVEAIKNGVIPGARG